MKNRIQQLKDFAAKLALKVKSQKTVVIAAEVATILLILFGLVVVSMDAAPDDVAVDSIAESDQQCDDCSETEKVASEEEPIKAKSEDTKKDTAQTPQLTALPFAKFDYQLGGEYGPPSGVKIVARDWYDSSKLPNNLYGVCYVNAFQTQPNDPDVKRIDEPSGWPASLVLKDIEDPNWEGELLIDISTNTLRTKAAAHVTKMIETCASKGFQAVEFDNLDSYTRFKNLPFDKSDMISYASMLVKAAHGAGLVAGQKNLAELTSLGKKTIGFDFAVAEECAEYDECDAYTGVYGKKVMIIEYSKSGFNEACAGFKNKAMIIQRDLLLVPKGKSGYVFNSC